MLGKRTRIYKDVHMFDSEQAPHNREMEGQALLSF